ncbi:hypothetical protein NC652_030642 [Populus alba x Populus x berolinensis]|nr:hypothetical protein NC652_030642 [Populus alba x Populus x berolinensis]
MRKWRIKRLLIPIVLKRLTELKIMGLKEPQVFQEVERMETTRVEEVEGMEDQQFKKDSEDIPVEICPGVSWDVFRRQDIPKLIDYLRTCYKDLWKPDNIVNDFVTDPLYDGTAFLNAFHKRQLKEEFGVEPWSFEQHLGQAVFVPAGCPFQARNLQSNVQLGLDFLSPESLGVSARLAEEIRCLPNDHEAKLQVLEVGKMSLYAASSAIKEVQKLVLDPKLGAEIGFEDRNLTAAVAENLEKGAKPRQIRCIIYHHEHNELLMPPKCGALNSEFQPVVINLP